MHQTPASRRFLPSSSVPHSQRVTRYSQNVQFSHPPIQASSSPHLRTPFSHTLQNIDEIENSFEEHEESAINLAKSYSPNKRQIIQGDVIEDDLELEYSTPGVKNFALLTQNRASRANRDLIHDDDDHGRGDTNDRGMAVTSPLPKRLKMFHLSDASTSIMNISSSADASDPDPANIDLPGLLDGGDKPNFQSVAKEDEIHDLEDGHIFNHKFLPRYAITDDAHDGSGTHTKRTAFKGLGTNSDSTAGEPLPITFSPSKSRGKQDYIHGGAAETVRGWILDIANEQHKVNEMGPVNLNVTPISMDRSGRFEVVRDQNHKIWMLAHQAQQEHCSSPPHSRYGEATVQNRSISLKGRKSTWMIEVLAHGDEGQESSTLNVAVLWGHP